MYRNGIGALFTFYVLGLLFWVSSGQSQVFIPFSYWGCSAVPTSFDNTTQSEFEAGTMTNVAWTASQLALTVGQTSGTYTSRPFDKTNHCENATINPFINLSWVTDLPYGKEIPASNELTTVYTALANSTLQTNIVGVWHFNGTGAIANGAAIAAAPGSNGTASNAGGAGMTYATAKLQNGITFDGADDYVDIPYTQTNVTRFTVAAWVRLTSTANNVIWQDRGGGAGLSLTLGVGNNPGGCTAGNVSFGVDSNSIYVGKCGTTTVNDGNWHHIVGVYNGAAGAVTSAQFAIYIDGVAAGTTNTSIGSPTAPLTGLGNTKIGRHDAWTVNFNGTIDEVAAWTRALSATEVQQLYRRGGNRVKFQIRSCTSPSCADNPTWLGYDGSSSTFFTELNNNTLPAAMNGSVRTTLPVMTFSDYVSLILPNSRYFQYKINFESDSLTLVPSVKSVSTSY